MSELLDGKTILITGGTGSFGRAFITKALREHQPKKIIVYSRDEWKQWEMRQNNPLFNSPAMRYFLGDVRDKDRLRNSLQEVDIVIHAAALKQVPAAEYNPAEFVKTNIGGANNLIEAAIEAGVKQVVALSTDKAVNPINLYGATKLASDKLFVAGNAYVGARGYPRFAVVRYGNVLGSRGSILPLWQQLIEEGADSLPVTDPRMTRFWITLEQAVDLVMHSLETMCGGEIFIPKIPSMLITDLAKAIAPELPLKVIGIRPGEKLHEIMFSEENARHTFDFGKYYLVVQEKFAHDFKIDAQNPYIMRGGCIVPDEFSYSSNRNNQWLTPDALREVIKSSEFIPILA